MTFHERSLLFANLASIAYNDDIEQVKKLVRKLGFTTVEFYNKDGAQAYRFMNKIDLVIACRGTQPTEFNDISADLKAMPVVAETVSRVHRGFKAEVDELWPMISEDLARKTNRDKEVWFCGHSLGAAMATIMASRCALNYDFPEVDCLFTYGSPRVGWPNYVKSLKIRNLYLQDMCFSFQAMEIILAPRQYFNVVSFFVNNNKIMLKYFQYILILFRSFISSLGWYAQ